MPEQKEERTPAEKHERHMRGFCPECPDEPLEIDTDGIAFCAACGWSED